MAQKGRHSLFFFGTSTVSFVSTWLAHSMSMRKGLKTKQLKKETKSKMQSWTCGVKRIITLILSIQFWMLALGSKYNHLFNCFKPFSISLLAGAPWVLRLHFSPYTNFKLFSFCFWVWVLASFILWGRQKSLLFCCSRRRLIDFFSLGKPGKEWVRLLWEHQGSFGAIFF